MRPVHASKKENESEVWENLFRDDEQAKKSNKFKIGDSVKISRIKGIFKHGFLPNWTEQIYKIHKINKSTPFTYILKDLQDDIIEGGFYKKKLQKTSQEMFRIEKVLRKKKINKIKHGFVKWIGYSNRFNEWLPVSKINSIKKNKLSPLLYRMVFQNKYNDDEERLAALRGQKTQYTKSRTHVNFVMLQF